MSLEFEYDGNLRCYFFGQNFAKNKMKKSAGLAGFAIPDLGIVFRSRLTGTLFECQYMGLLALLRFIDTNIRNFKGLRFEILSDSAVVIYQVTHRKFVSRELASSFRAIVDYQKRIPFKVSWVPAEENIAFTGLSEMPSISANSDLKLDIEIKDNNMELGKGYILY